MISGSIRLAAVMHPSSSAAATTTLPAGVTGVVPPKMGMVAKFIGNLYFIASAKTSHDRLSSLSGDVVQYAFTKIAGSDGTALLF